MCLSDSDVMSAQLSLVKIKEIDQAFVDMILASHHPLCIGFHLLILRLFDIFLVRARIGRSRMIGVSNSEMAKFCNEARLARCHQAEQSQLIEFLALDKIYNVKLLLDPIIRLFHHLLILGSPTIVFAT